MNNLDFYVFASFSRICGEIGIGLDMVVGIMKYYCWRPSILLLKCDVVRAGGQCLKYDIDKYDVNSIYPRYGGARGFYECLVFAALTFLRSLGKIESVYWSKNFVRTHNGQSIPFDVTSLATSMETKKCIPSDIEPITSINKYWSEIVRIYIVEN